MEADEKRLVGTLQKLIRIPSHENSLGVSKWIKNEMEAAGYKVASDSDGNLLAEIGKGQGFLLNAHMDTVGLGSGWKHESLGGKIDDGKIYGRGSSDCKAGIASMIEIARILKNKKTRKRVVFAFTAYEEGYTLEMNGIYKSIPKLKNIDKGILLEPSTEGNTIKIGVGCRGTDRFELQIIGERGHSSMPEKYRNPIYMFPAFLELVKKFGQKKMHAPLAKTDVFDNLTVTEICAKEGANVIPGSCMVTLDRRSLPGENPDEFQKKLDSICRQAFGDRYRLERKGGAGGYYHEDEDFLRLCETSIRSAGFRPEPIFESGRTDSAILYNFGKIGTFVVGPGSMGVAHSIDECCEIRGLVGATNAILKIIEKWDSS